MAASTFADRMAVSEELVNWIWKHRATLTQLGVNAEFFHGNLKVSSENLKTANTAQEMAKASLKNHTIAVTAADRQNYAIYTSTIDVIAGAYGKYSPEAKTLRRMRSKLHRPDRAPPTP